MKRRTHQEIAESIRRDLQHSIKQLHDSPKSLRATLEFLRGFYWGYCEGAEVDEDYDLVQELTNAIKNT